MAEENKVEWSFIDKGERMPFNELGIYIFSILKRLNGETHGKNIFLRNKMRTIPKNKETYEELITIFLQKADLIISDFENSKYKHRKKHKEMHRQALELVALIKKIRDKLFDKPKTLDNSEVTSIENKVNLRIEKFSWRILPKGEWNTETILTHFRNLTSKNNWSEKNLIKAEYSKYVISFALAMPMLVMMNLRVMLFFALIGQKRLF